MKFGPVPLQEAEGAVLAHSVRIGGSVGRGRRIAKGSVLTRADIAGLSADGVTSVTVARLEPGDVPEDEAATRLARAVIPDPAAARIRIARGAKGRVNLHAAGVGLVRLDRAAIEAVNSVDPMITLATLPDHQRIGEGGMIATIKIISYAVSHDALRQAERAGAAAMRVAAPVFTTATLIETRTGPEVPSPKGREAMAMRLDRFAMRLTERAFARHETADLADAILRASGEMILILTASATSDPEDVAPAALRKAGGQVTRVGMPVDPGNLLFLGHLGDRPVIGLPGCARSPALNGADWVLERVICGQTPTSADIAAMAVGGLLKEIPTRPQPR